MNIRDFAIGIVATPPSPATSGTSLVLDTGQGADMPVVPFNLLLAPPGELPTKYNAELVEVTARTTDTLTITRAQGETTAKTVVADWIAVNPVLVDDVLSGNVLVSDENPTGAVNGTNTVFTTSKTYITGTLEVFVNGLKQARGVHYTETTSTTFTMDTAPDTGDVVRVNYLHTEKTTGNAQTLDGLTVAGLLNKMYPVGVLAEFTVSTNPGDASMVGIGTWTAHSVGRVTVSKAASGTFGTAGATGGAETHTLTTAEMPAHTHASGTLAANTSGSHEHGTPTGQIVSRGSNGTGSFETAVSGGRSLHDASTTATNGSHSHSMSGSTGSAGSGNAHNNLQPYVVVYRWERTA